MYEFTEEKNEELKNFLNYILDKVESCYREEVKIAINRFLNN